MRKLHLRRLDGDRHRHRRRPVQRHPRSSGFADDRCDRARGRQRRQRRAQRHQRLHSRRQGLPQRHRPDCQPPRRQHLRHGRATAAARLHADRQLSEGLGRRARTDLRRLQHRQRALQARRAERADPRRADPEPDRLHRTRRRRQHPGGGGAGFHRRGDHRQDPRSARRGRPNMPSHYGQAQGVASISQEHLSYYCDANDAAAGLCDAPAISPDADQQFSSLFGSGTYADQNAVNTAKDYAINLIEPVAPAALRGDQLTSAAGQDAAVRRRSYNARMSLAQSFVDQEIGMQTPSVPLTTLQQQYLTNIGLPVSDQRLVAAGAADRVGTAHQRCHLGRHAAEHAAGFGRARDRDRARPQQLPAVPDFQDGPAAHDHQRNATRPRRSSATSSRPCGCRRPRWRRLTEQTGPSPSTEIDMAEETLGNTAKRGRQPARTHRAHGKAAAPTAAQAPNKAADGKTRGTGGQGPDAANCSNTSSARSRSSPISIATLPRRSRP